MLSNRIRTLFFVTLAAAFLSGCAGTAIEGARVAGSKVVISQNIDAARAGDAEAQYKVGNAYCCSIHEGTGLYNTPTSVEWLCSAARQDYAPAMLKLGKIYSGDVIDGVRLQRRVLQGVAGTSTNLPVALAWLELADERGESGAADLAEEIREDLSEAEQSSASELYGEGLDAPCQWDEVIGS